MECDISFFLFLNPFNQQIKVVHICEATLTKRLIEFENTESGSLTVCSIKAGRINPAVALIFQSSKNFMCIYLVMCASPLTLVGGGLLLKKDPKSNLVIGAASVMLKFCFISEFDIIVNTENIIKEEI